MTGKIRNLSNAGWGFVSATDGLDYFFHRSALPDADLFHELAEGDEMELIEVENAPRGWKATRLIPVSAAA